MLKWLALFFMVIDHIAYYFHDLIPDDAYLVMRTIGRLAFPIFAYGIVLGMRRTRNISRYFIRLASFAILGQFIMEAAARSVGDETFVNVLFTLAAGLMLIFGIELVTCSMQDVILTARPIPIGMDSQNKANPTYNVRVNLKGITMPAWLGIMLGGILVVAALAITIILEPDYGVFGLSMMLLFYILENQMEPYTKTLALSLRQKRFRTFFVSLGLLNLVNAVLTILANPDAATWAIVSMFSTFSVCFFHLQGHGGKRPPRWEKYVFYLFYPLHIALFILLSA